MIIIPAVDIRDGRCVRLYQGLEDRETVYGADPAGMALRWQGEGARYLHVVDLDGAFGGSPQNLGSLKELLERIAIPVEFGGGLRDIEVIRRVFKMGVDRAVLGTAALRDRDFLKSAVGEFGRQIFVGLDARNGFLAVDGWKTDTRVRPLDIIDELDKIGVGGVIYTDIQTDGALTGPNTAALKELLENSPLRVIASGGVSSLDHLRKLKELRGGRLYGVIIGRALYSGDLKLPEALKEMSEEDRNERGGTSCSRRGSSRASM